MFVFVCLFVCVCVCVPTAICTDLAKHSEKVLQINLICGTLDLRHGVHMQEQVVLFFILQGQCNLLYLQWFAGQLSMRSRQ